MSLRTKLLAVFVGLPGAILLVALALLIRADQTVPMEAVDELLHLQGEDVQILAPAVLRPLDAGDFTDAYVIEERRDKPVRIWTARQFYESAPDRDAPPAQPDVTDEDLRSRLLRYLRNAQGLAPPHKQTQSYVAMDLGPSRPRYGIVVEWGSPRAVARAVYWVMIGGIALMMVLSYVLISRLVVKPLTKLSAAADRIAEGDYNITIEGEHGADEVGRTVRAMNRMAREIAEYQGHLEDRVLSALGRMKKAEQHLAIAQRLAATGTLASGLAHEINNPLGGMKNAVRALARGDLSPERTELYLDLITDGLGRVEQTVKKFLSFTPRTIEPHPVDLSDVAEKSVALAMHKLEKQNIEVETTVPPAGEAIVFGDPHELQQVALNLLLNAADAIEEGKAGRIDVSVERTSDEVVLAVTDNGSGISPEDQDRVFDIFFTTKSVGEGSGMGLAVVHNIVTNHGGRIELTSEPGAGTTFQVFLPGESTPDAQPAPAAAEARPPNPS